jgi:hypothetical protein
MTSPPSPATAPPPGLGSEVWLEDLVGGPWRTVVSGHEGDLVRVAAPRLGRRRVALPLGESFTLTYRSREVPCEAPAVLEPPGPGGCGRRDEYLVRFLAPPIRLQRRGAVRVPIQLIARAAARDVRGLDAAAVLSGVTENVSADGVLVRLARPLSLGDVVEVAIQCGGVAGTIQGVAAVVRCEKGGTASRPWRVAFAFRDLDPRRQDRLVRHLFERQRELRRRELEERERAGPESAEGS